jgi:hypothetical protein
VDLQHAETAAEGDLLFGGDALVAQHHDVVVEVSAVDSGEVQGVDRFGQVEADDLGTHGAGEWTNLKRLRCTFRGSQGN